MTRQLLIRRRADILRKAVLCASITIGAGMWALTMLRVAGVEVVWAPRFDAIWIAVAQSL